MLVGDGGLFVSVLSSSQVIRWELTYGYCGTVTTLWVGLSLRFYCQYSNEIDLHTPSRVPFCMWRALFSSCRYDLSSLLVSVRTSHSLKILSKPEINYF